ncbi:major facilitator superfamily domain-containing protein 1-like isoform X1 [Mauremys reevesii]|uniref:major facilitator superfamily domain-containing protein 1-like isoform X1 n=2 Tax=Mauremys reevesii TaxID=260615 RepID=UPI00193F929D|nr:major facilitator superfamily domain-containing protein 1-like isoform X1 [Mauremys reevesii]
MVAAAERAYYRFLVLFFNCLLTFGSYFCFDIPSVLQEQFQGNLTCPNGTQHNGTGHNGTLACVEGLGMTPAQYNLLYAIYAWTNALVVILAGFLIDKLGNHFGVFLFSFLIVLGSSIFALGSHFKGTQYLLPLMLMGRLLFGSGNGSLTNIQESLTLIPSGPPSMNWEIAPVVQNRITAFWFKGKELALAFGLTLSFSRLGSVLNFFFTQQFETHFGIQWTLWGGTLLCTLGFISAITVSMLDKVGMKQLGLDGVIQQESKKVRVQDVRRLPLRYWLLVLTIMFFYNGVFPFVADASKFIQDKYSGYSQQAAAYIAGAVYDSSLVLSAAVGILIDYVGLRGVFAVGCAVLTLPVFALLAFTFVPPLVSTIWLGITYSFAAASLWPSIPLVVPQATLGTAMGLATSVQMIGSGLSNLIVGHILGTKSSELKIPLWRWQQMMIFLLANTIACITASVSLTVVDKQQGGTLNRATKRSSAEQVRQPVDTAPLLDEVGDEGLIN